MDIRPTAPPPEPCRCCKGRRGRLVGFQLLDQKMKLTLCTVCDTGPSFGQGPPVLIQAIQEGWAT